MPKDLIELSERIEHLKSDLQKIEDPKMVIGTLRNYLHLIMVRYALKIQKELTGKLNMADAFHIADKHIKSLKLEEFANG